MGDGIPIIMSMTVGSGLILVYGAASTDDDKDKNHAGHGSASQLDLYSCLTLNGLAAENSVNVSHSYSRHSITNRSSFLRCNAARLIIVYCVTV